MQEKEAWENWVWVCHVNIFVFVGTGQRQWQRRRLQTQEPLVWVGQRDGRQRGRQEAQEARKATGTQEQRGGLHRPRDPQVTQPPPAVFTRPETFDHLVLFKAIRSSILIVCLLEPWPQCWEDYTLKDLFNCRGSSLNISALFVLRFIKAYKKFGAPLDR